MSNWRDVFKGFKWGLLLFYILLVLAVWAIYDDIRKPSFTSLPADVHRIREEDYHEQSR